MAFVCRDSARGLTYCAAQKNSKLFISDAHGQLMHTVDLSPFLFSSEQELISGVLLPGSKYLVIGFSTDKIMQNVGTKKVPQRGGRGVARGGRGGRQPQMSTVSKKKRVQPPCNVLIIQVDQMISKIKEDKEAG